MKTAIEWYQKAIFEILKEKENLSDEIFLQNILNAHLQAKEMEKQAHEETWDVAHQAGRFEGKGIAEENWQTFEQYYNETFKS
jgi:hypothetical protein